MSKSLAEAVSHRSATQVREPHGDPLYISHHIPKTAGTTLGAFFAGVFGPRYQEAYLDHPDAPFVEDPQCIHGHDVREMFAERISAHRNVKWITFVRDPLSVALSLYFHTRKVLDPSQFVDRGLEHWLTHAEEFRWPDPPCYCHNQYGPLKEFDFVGIAEQFDASIMLLCHQFGWSPHTYTTLNMGSYAPPALDQAIIDRFRQLNERDYATYDRYVTVLAQRKQAYGAGFEEALEAFRLAWSRSFVRSAPE